MEFNLHNTLNLEISKEIQKAIQSIYPQSDMIPDLKFEIIYKLLSAPPKSDMGELAFPCFSLSKALKNRFMMNWTML